MVKKFPATHQLDHHNNNSPDEADWSSLRNCRQEREFLLGLVIYLNFSFTAPCCAKSHVQTSWHMKSCPTVLLAAVIVLITWIKMNLLVDQMLILFITLLHGTPCSETKLSHLLCLSSRMASQVYFSSISCTNSTTKIVFVLICRSQDNFCFFWFSFKIITLIQIVSLDHMWLTKWQQLL